MPQDGLILIVARNNLHLTKLAIKSALNQSHPCCVWVIDNASTDGTHDWLRSKEVRENNRLHWWTFMNQRSLSYCWNDGLHRAFNLNQHKVLVLNNDVEISCYTYSTLEQWPAQFVTAISVNSESELAPERKVFTESPHPDFSCFMISSACYEITGDFDDLFYPAYCEDNDYHVRMHRAGIQAVSIDLPYLHHGASTIKHADPVEQAAIRRGHDLNKDRFYAKYGCYPTDAAYAKLFNNNSRSPAKRTRTKRAALINQA